MKFLRSLFIVICVTLVMLEILLQVFSAYDTLDPTYVQSNSVMYTPNEATGFIPLPNQSIGIQNVWDSGYDAHYQINNLSYRGDDLTFEKPDDTIRLLVLGGSATFDTLAEHNQDWSHLIGSNLNETETNNHYQVINAGVPGYNTFNSMMRLMSEGWMFNPDYVLIYHCWNDIKYFPSVTENTSYLQLQNVDIPAQWDAYNDINYVNSIDALLGNSQIYLSLRRGFSVPTLTRESTSIDLDVTNHYQEIALEQYHNNIVNIVNFTRGISAEPVLVLQSRLVDENNTELEQRLIKYEYVGMSQDVLVEAFRECDDTMVQIAEQYDVELIDNTDELNGDIDMFVDHVHTTPLGSERLAEIITADMIDIIDN